MRPPLSRSVLPVHLAGFQSITGWESDTAHDIHPQCYSRGFASVHPPSSPRNNQISCDPHWILEVASLAATLEVFMLRFEYAAQ